MSSYICREAMDSGLGGSRSDMFGKSYRLTEKCTAADHPPKFARQAVFLPRCTEVCMHPPLHSPSLFTCDDAATANYL